MNFKKFVNRPREALMRHTSACAAAKAVRLAQAGYGPKAF